MKKTTKHLSVQELRNSELRAVKGGRDIITCGIEGDLCARLTVEVPTATGDATALEGFPHELHKIVVT